MFVVLIFRLKNARNRKDISQDKLAELSGYSQSYISELEQNKKSPTLNTINDFAQALNVSPYTLLLDTERNKRKKFF